MLLKLENLTYCLGEDTERLITVSGTVPEGSVLVIRGPSGAGKSTLLRVLARLKPCLNGRVLLKGKEWFDIPAAAWRTTVHYLPQSPVTFDGTAADNLAKPFTTAIMKNKTPDWELVEKLVSELLLPPKILEQEAKTLSGGEAARMAFIRSLLVDPAVLLLDEPTAALDSKARQAFYKVLARWLKAPGRAALLISHNEDYEALENISYLDITTGQGGN
ncbi:MAG: ATP-binding cassette domain-containing protein [Desulfotomaculum sp.]|nr:ATP-binding cassette domain-containing protein [Desulfotomaculum sp.]